MSLPTKSCSRIVIYQVALFAALLMLVTPVFAQPVPSTTALSWDCPYTAANPCPTSLGPQTVTFAESGGAAADVTSIEFLQPNGPSGAVARVFYGEKFGSQVTVAIDRNQLSLIGNNILTAGGTYSGVLRATFAPSTVVTVSLTLTVNASQVSSITLSPSSLALSTNVGGTTSATVSVNSGTSVSYSATATTQNGINWLQITQNTGLTPGTITVLAYAGALSSGSYTGSINISAGGSVLTVPVTLTVGTGTTGLTLSPNPINLSTANSSTPTNATVIATSTLGTATFYQASVTQGTGGNWLSVGTSGQTFTSGSMSGSVAIPLYANPAGLGTGTYTATLTVVTSPNNLSTSATVTLQVGSGGGSTGLLTINPSTIAFSAPTLNLSPTGQIFSVTSPAFNTSYTMSVSSSGWLTVNGSTFLQGILNNSASFSVAANTLNLPSGSYNGTISISTTGGVTTTALIYVSLTVGFGGGGTGATIAPQSLTFSGQANGRSYPGQQYIAVGGSGGLYTVTSSVNSGSGWLTVDSTSGSAPYWVTVSVNPSGLAAGSYTGNVAITQNGITTNVPVTLSLTSGAAVVSNPSGIFTNAYSGGTPPVQTLYLTMSDGSSGQTYTATPSATWITVSPASGTMSGSTGLAVQLNGANIPAGLNTGSVTLTVSGAANSPLTIPITLANGNSSGGTGSGYLSFSQSSLSFTDTNQAAQVVLVSSSLGTLSYSATATTSNGSNWLFVSPSVGVTPSNLTVSVSPSGLTTGTYSGNINVTANGQTQSLPVTLTIGTAGSGAITASPTSLSFTARGSTAPASQRINLSGSGSTVSWQGSVTTASGGTWLSLSTAAGPLPGSLDVNVNPAGLAAGNYTGTITFTPNFGSQTTVAVTLTVTAAPTVTASPASITLNYRSGDAVPGTQQITVSAKDSTTPLEWTASVTGGSSWLSISPTSGNTSGGTVNVNVSPGSLDPGSYNGVITIAGTNGAGGSNTINVSLTVTAPLPNLTRVVNGASYTSGALAPGEIIVITGTAIGPNETARGSVDSSTGRWATTVGGVQVLVNGFNAPVLYATSGQVGAIVPYSVSGRLDAFVQIRYRGLTSNTITLPVTTTVPGLFTANAAGNGQGAILNADNSVNGSGNPAAKGSTVVLYATGEGVTQNASGARPETGQVVQFISIPDLPKPLLPVAVLIDGQAATVTYAGQAPGQIAGLFQINVTVPPAAGSGNVPVVVSVGSNSSQSGVTLAVR